MGAPAGLGCAKCGMCHVWDVIVIGAGPAGTAAAAAALRSRRDARVLLLDKDPFPRDKACGDGIAAEAIDVLDDLGFDIPAVLQGFVPIDRLRLTAPGGTVTERRMVRPVRTIPRQVLDARLVADVVGRGAVLQQRKVRSVVQGPDGVLVDGSLHARAAVGADGAESVVRRAAGATDPGAGRVALALRGYSRAVPGQGRAQWITMSERHWPAYAWSFPIGDGTVNVGYGELLDRPLTRSALLQRMSELLPGLEPPSRLRAHRLPLSPGRPRIADGRIVLAGDALSLINPISGEGIFYALRSGALAGRSAMLGSAAGAMYRGELAAALGRHFRSTDVAARLIRGSRFIDGAVRAAGARQAVFDDLVNLALGDGRLTPRLLAGVVLRPVGRPRR